MFTVHTYLPGHAQAALPAVPALATVTACTPAPCLDLPHTVAGWAALTPATAAVRGCSPLTGQHMHSSPSCLKPPGTWAAQAPGRAADNSASPVQVRQAHLPLVPQAALHRGQEGCRGALALGCVLASAALPARSIQCLLLIHLPGCPGQLLRHPAHSQQQSVGSSLSHPRLAYP